MFIYFIFTNKYIKKNKKMENLILNINNYLEMSINYLKKHEYNKLENIIHYISDEKERYINLQFNISLRL